MMCLEAYTLSEWYIYKRYGGGGSGSGGGTWVVVGSGGWWGRGWGGGGWAGVWVWGTDRYRRPNITCQHMSECEYFQSTPNALPVCRLSQHSKGVSLYAHSSKLWRHPGRAIICWFACVYPSIAASGLGLQSTRGLGCDVSHVQQGSHTELNYIKM